MVCLSSCPIINFRTCTKIFKTKICTEENFENLQNTCGTLTEGTDVNFGTLQNMIAIMPNQLLVLTPRTHTTPAGTLTTDPTVKKFNKRLPVQDTSLEIILAHGDSFIKIKIEALCFLWCA